MQPLVEDAVELKDLTVAVYREVKQVDWDTATDEAVSLALAAMRMPTMLFERLADRLDEVERNMSRKQEPLPGPGTGSAQITASL